MDISDLYTADRHNAGADMAVKDADGVVTDMVITLAGVDSRAWRMAEAMKRGRMLEAMASGDADEAAFSVLMQTVADATIGWRGIESGGEPLAFTQEAAISLYTNAPYILDQVYAFIGDRANFTGPQPTK